MRSLLTRSLAGTTSGVPALTSTPFGRGCHGPWNAGFTGRFSHQRVGVYLYFLGNPCSENVQVGLDRLWGFGLGNDQLGFIYGNHTGLGQAVGRNHPPNGIQYL
ncbi:MAG: hypothetical protein IPN74_11175 [Haliscomenobacter sp.]|nr:hypothetical protein [Haliscomenobacter sp.]